MEEDIKLLLSGNEEIMTLLTIIKGLNLNDSWLCAGTVRNFIWDSIAGYNNFLKTDIDVIFYDTSISYEETFLLEKKLKKDFPSYQWELKNQVYMHVHNPGAVKYTSSYDAISKFPETCTSIGVKLIGEEMILMCPHGLDDLVNLQVKPTSFFKETPERLAIYTQRVKSKKWQKRWKNIVIYDN